MDEPNYPIVVSAGTIQTTLLAALRMLAVLIGGLVAIFGFIAKRDLTGLIAYVQSSDFLAVAGAIAALASFAWGAWKTYRTKHDLVTVTREVDNSVGVVVEKPTSAGNVALGIIPLLFLLLAAGSLVSCATTGGDAVRLNASKAFLTAQIALKSTQQTVLAVCSTPLRQASEPCNKAIDLLHAGAQAEAAGFTAQRAGSAADLQTAIIALTNLPPQLVALGVLEAN